MRKECKKRTEGAKTNVCLKGSSTDRASGHELLSVLAVCHDSSVFLV